MLERINKTQSLFFEKTSKIDESVLRAWLRGGRDINERKQRWYKLIASARLLGGNYKYSTWDSRAFSTLPTPIMATAAPAPTESSLPQSLGYQQYFVNVILLATERNNSDSHLCSNFFFYMPDTMLLCMDCILILPTIEPGELGFGWYLVYRWENQI